MIDRPDWSTSTEQPGTQLVPAASQESPPTFTADDLALIDAPASEPAVVDLDEEDVAQYRRLLAQGIFTPEELAKHYGLSAAELDALQGPPRPGSRQKIEAEIAEIEKRMREDRRAYSKDEALQARYRDLLELRNRMPATSTMVDARQPSDGSGLDPELLATWEKQAGVASSLRRVQATVGTMIDALEPDDAGALQASFDALPQGAQSAVYAYLALDGGNWRPATDAAVKAFGETEEGAELVGEWGDKAAQNVARVSNRMRMILDTMTPGDRAKAQKWFDGLPGPQAKAVMLALAR